MQLIGPSSKLPGLLCAKSNKLTLFNAFSLSILLSLNVEIVWTYLIHRGGQPIDYDYIGNNWRPFCFILKFTQQYVFILTIDLSHISDFKITF